MNYLLDHLTLKHLFLFIMVIVIIKTVSQINHHNMITFSPPTNNKKIKAHKSHKKIRRR